MPNIFCSSCSFSMMSTMRICPKCGGKALSPNQPIKQTPLLSSTVNSVSTALSNNKISKKIFKYFSIGISLLILLIAIGFGKAIGKGVANYFYKPSNSVITNELNNIATKINSTLPKMVDSETRLDKTTTKDKTITYHYTLINFGKDQKISELSEEIHSFMDSKIKNEFCNNDTYSIFINKNINVEFFYYRNDSQFITSIFESPRDCKNMA